MRLRSSFSAGIASSVLVASLVVPFLTGGIAHAQGTNQAQQIVIPQGESTIVLEPYAPNVIRVTLSLDKAEAMAAPGYGIEAKPAPSGWNYEEGESARTYRSSRMVVTLLGGNGKVDAAPKPEPTNVQKTQASIARFFNGSAPWADIRFTTPDGKLLLEMNGWQMSVPNHKDGNASILYDKRPSDKDFYQVGATFASPADEHYYGLGQNQEGYLDHRGHTVECWNNYTATGGPTWCIPFAVTNKGYGLVWDNPSQTTIEPGFNEQTRWISQVGNRVSFFVIAGQNTDEIYSGYRLLTGATPMLPKAAYGYIQCKQRYITQDELMGVAKGYRDRHLPADVLVVDWFYYTRMGQMDLDPKNWPDPKAMNDELHKMGFETMISVWPRFVPDDRFYDLIKGKGWFEQLADGTPTNGLPYDRAGSDIDTTNPDAAKWYWDTIRDNILSKGFDSLWADETEPDLPPNGSFYHIGPGTRYYNVYPLFHTGALYDGFRRDTKNRALILSRDAYLGVQSKGTIVWSSDISGTWDTLKRQIPTGLDAAASGLAYWSNDTGGWQYLPAEHHPAHPPLLDPSDARDNVGGYDDYPELYTRWFEYATFLPIMRTHGSRNFNETWSYGKQAEPILEKYLKLRYELMPYIYSLGHSTYESGAPYMRALFMDFPNDDKAANVSDEYMFGPAFLVAPVTDQGVTSREVYLPAGTDWYNYWTNERVHGGQTISVSAPIDKLPLFVRAGSILPLGVPVLSTHEPQALARIRIYPGADASFTLYQDDGKTYAYEKGESKITHLHWNDAAAKLSHEGPAAWEGPDSSLLEVVGRR
jgi:alpha-D-xyloside xylohydrolase